MRILPFLTQPFTIDVKGTTYSLSKKEKTIIIISGIAGLAFFGIGALFTFYGASYLLRKFKYQEITNPSMVKIHTKPPKTQTVFEKMKKNVLEIIQELKPMQELKSIFYTAHFYSKNKTCQMPTQTITENSSKDLQDELNLAIDKGFKDAEEAGIQNDSSVEMKWSIIAEDKQNKFHGVISRLQEPLDGMAESKSFYRNCDLKFKDQLMKSISKKMGIYQT